jgi:glucosamine 6-phosphate synthetase-like amidotransferase/phosphosugar isomerase protein
MCGIAGYSFSAESRVQRTLAAQALLAGIAERGADAVGYAFRAPGSGPISVYKRRSGASEVLDRIVLPASATQVLVHVRDYTKGHPSIPANNHPVRHGRVVGIHNGIIVNDDELLDGHACARVEDGMSVDSEAIFAVAAHAESDPRALERLRGSMAAAWLDEREPELLFAARGVGRPLWLGVGPDGVFFASTALALGVLEHYCSLRLQKRPLHEGTSIALGAGAIVERTTFSARHFVEENELPAVRAPEQRASCLGRLATIASAA